MELTPGLRHAHQGLSAIDLKFREYASRSPACLDRKTFASFDQRHPLLHYRLQSWPTFIDRDKIDQFADLSVRINALIRGLLERIFDNDPRRITEFYGLEDVAFAELVLTPPNSLDTLMSRGDFILTETGFQCLEFNMASNLGGWETPILARFFSEIDPVFEFINELPPDVDVSYRNTVRLLFEHVIRAAQQVPLRACGEINSALGMLLEFSDSVDNETLVEFLSGEYEAALRRVDPDLRGTIHACAYPDLEVKESALYYRGRWLHNLIEQHSLSTERIALQAFKAGQLNLFNGPISHLLSDKRNLALLSEFAGSDRFSAEESALIRRHIPWTRQILEGETRYQDSQVRLRDFLLAEQPRMVIKKAVSYGGEDVIRGDNVGAERWAKHLATAFESSDWVAQERVDSLPFLYQSGDHGCSPHDVVWGPFVFGSTYAGTILRMQPRTLGGIVNLTQGASEGMIFEISSDTGETAEPLPVGPVIAPRPARVRAIVHPELAPELRQAHEGLSAIDLAFREHACGIPASLDRQTFALLDQRHPLVTNRMQSWPTFIDRDKIDQFADLSVRLNALIRSLPERIVGNDPRQVSEFYGLENVASTELILTPPNSLDMLLSRGDFILTPAGFKCVEFNMVSNLGGWETAMLARLFMEIDPVYEFIEELPIEIDISYRNTVRLLFEHVIRAARQAPVCASDEINTALGVLLEFNDPADNEKLVEFLSGEYEAALSRVDSDLRGTVHVCTYPSLEIRGGALYYQGHRLHNLIEHHSLSTERVALQAQKAGQLNLFNGPIDHILSDKRNLALLSEFAGSDHFSAEESALIRRHIPWTRRVLEGETRYRGSQVRLRDFLLAEQSRMVIKKARSYGGEDVIRGDNVTVESWTRQVATACESGDWVAQERVDSLPFLYQNGDYGCSPHDVVWGPFIFGSTYAGTILRMQPKVLGGIVNLTQGATEGILFEVSDKAS